MKLQRFLKKISLLCAGLLLSAVIVSAAPARTIAANYDGFDPRADHKGEAGVYLYRFEGTLSNPCHWESKNSKPSVINSFYFDFTLTEDNGTGGSFGKRFDMSYDGWGNRNGDFLNDNFVRWSDDETGLSFELWLPGQLSRMDIHLELNGYIGWFNYERMSFSIDRIFCDGKQINKSSDYVNSSTDSSNGSVSIVMDRPDAKLITGITHDGDLTEKQYSKMVSEGTLGSEVRDSYNVLLTKAAINNLLTDPDNAVNQKFSHSDEAGMFLYTLNMKVENAINMNSAGYDAVEEFVIDFTYNGSQHYKLDMSWDGSRNRNERFLNIFRSSGDDSYTAKLNIWLPGKINKINILLNMAGGERLRIDFADVLINGFKVNTKTDYVTSAYYDSRAEIECKMPDSQIDIRDLSEDETKAALDLIFNGGDNSSEKPLIDQFGSPADKELIKAAHDEMNEYINATGVTVDTGYRSADVIKGFAMYRTVYCANMLEEVQRYVETKCSEHLASMSSTAE